MSRSVFISYAREDDEPFVKRIHKDLTRAGFEVWWDRVSMPSRRLTFYQEIADAIRSHDRLILVVGPRAAVSDYVRQEWRWALDLDKPVIPILRKGDYTHVPGELSSLQCDDFRDEAQYSAQVARLIENLRQPEPPLGALFAVPSLPPHFLDRPDLLRQVKTALLADLKAPVVITASDARVGVHGMGGIGKSVLAAAIAHNRGVRRSYPDGVIWLTVGQQPNVVRLEHDVAHYLGNKEHFDTETQGQGVLRQLLAQKAVLLVLDDVWNARDAQAFDILGPRCRALITTRDAGILHTLGGPSVPVSVLTEEQALQLLADAVGVEPPALPPEAHEIVKECGYLPLAVALCGSMVKKLSGDWTVVLERLDRADLEKIADRHAIDERHRSIWRTMKVSVDALPADEQRRFAELAVFVTDNPVPEATVATLWSHTGNLSDLDTSDLLVDLADRSLIRLHQKAPTPGEPIKRCFSLHDLLHDYGTRLAGERRAQNEALVAAYRKRCNDGWPSGPDDGYFYQRLAYHLQRAGGQQELKELLFDYRWLRKKLEVTDGNGLIADYEYAGDDPEAQFVQDALRLSSHVLARGRSHLPSQLLGRLLSQEGSRIKALLDDMTTSEQSPWLRPLKATLSPAGGPLLRTLVGHEDRITAVAMTGDERYVVSASWDRTLRVWDLATGQLLRTLRGHEKHVTAVAVTQDGRYAVSASDDYFDYTLKVWDLATGQTVRTLRGHESFVHDVVITPDGRHAVSASDDHTLKVWDLATGGTVCTLRGHENRVTAVAVTGDGCHAVSASDDHTLRVWDLDTAETVHTLRGHDDEVKNVVVTPDGNCAVSSSWDGTLELWELATGKRLHAWRDAGQVVAAVIPRGDGHYAVACSWGPALKVWDLATGKILLTLRGHGGHVGAMAVTEDGRYAVSGSKDKTLKVWDLAGGKALHTLRGHEDEVSAVAVTPDGRSAVSGSYDKTLKVWDLVSGKAVKTLRGHEGWVTAVAVMGDGRYAVSGSSDQTLKVWDLAGGKALHTLRGHEDWVNAVAVTGDGRYAVSGSSDKTLKVWDLATGKAMHTLDNYQIVHMVAVTRHGRYVVSGHRGGLTVWELATGRAPPHFVHLWGYVDPMAVTEDGRYVVSRSGDTTLQFWDLATGKTVQIRVGHEARVHTAAVTGDGRYALSGSGDSTLRVWDLASEQVVSSFCGDSGITSCAFAPDERTIIVGEASGRVHFLRLENVK